MPELPEAEVVAGQIRTALIGARLTDCWVGRKDMVREGITSRSWYTGAVENIVILGGPGPFANPYSSTVDTILVHAGLSLHFNWEPPDWGQE
ncbi:MAG: hypothetical protein HP498_01145 [Nitrospira sp.]|nr:hypothetical protein [Nitrospira sp.]